MRFYPVTILLVLGLLGPLSEAENSTIATIYNQVRNGRYCAQVSQKDLEQAGCRDCLKGKSSIERLTTYRHDIFDQLIFQEAAKDQVNKNNCLAAQISELDKNQAALKTWLSQLAAGWMGLRKAKIILETCNEKVYSKLGPLDLQHMSVEAAYGKAMKRARGNPMIAQDPPLEGKWKELCFDEKKMQTLEAARSLFQYSMPVVSSNELFKIMEKNRQLIVNKNTGHPVTDEDLVGADLRDLTFIKFNPDQNFVTKISRNLNDFSSERSQVSTKFEAAKSKEGAYDLDGKLKDYLFEDGTIYDVLTKKNMIGPGYKNIAASSQDISNGAFCLLSKYEPTLSGEVLNLAVTSAVAGGVILKAFKTTKYFAGLSKGAQLKKGMMLGFAATGYTQIIKQIGDTCLSDISKTKKTTNASKTENFAFIAASDLPPEVGYKAYNAVIDPKEVPACKSAAETNLLLNPTHNSNCLLESLLMLAPLKISLPGLLIYQSF